MESGLATAKLSIPVQLIEYAFQNKLTRPLAVYIYLKFYTTGKTHKDSPVFDHLKRVLGIKDDRTLSKYLKTLLEHNWVGFNSISGNYFIRGFDLLREQLELRKRQAVVCYHYYLGKIQSFFTGAVICKYINIQKYLSVRKGRRASAVTHNRDVTFQPGTPSFHTKEYYGLANSIIAKILGCKQTRACQLKHKAEDDGFIKVKKRFRDYVTLISKDYLVRSQLYELNPKLMGRLKFITQKDSTIKIVEQLYDEIEPCLTLKSISRFSTIKSAA
jgi:hypothetical protein